MTVRVVRAVLVGLMAGGALVLASWGGFSEGWDWGYRAGVRQGAATCTSRSNVQPLRWQEPEILRRTGDGPALRYKAPRYAGTYSDAIVTQLAIACVRVVDAEMCMCALWELRDAHPRSALEDEDKAGEAWVAALMRCGWMERPEPVPEPMPEATEL